MAACAIINNGVLLLTSEPSAACQGYVLLDAVDYANWQTGLLNWSYDSNLLSLGIGGALLSWVSGLGVGLVISIVRKARL